MEPPQKLPFGRKTSVAAAEDDIISNLPDEILCHILSFLPTKHAVATAILSTKWKTLFSSIPNLNIDFDDSLLLHPDPPPNSNPIDRTTSFINFMYRVLIVILQDDQNIRQFELNCHQEYDDTHINNWVCAALIRNAVLLDLSFTMKNPNLLLHSLSGCTALKHLTFRKHLRLDVPSSFLLPNLTDLLLGYTEFVNEDSIRNLFAGCPVLEDLYMYSCDLESISVLYISIPTLKGLNIENCYNEFGYEIVLDSPVIESFTCKDNVAEGYPVKNLNSLQCAHIEVRLTDEQLEGDRLLYDENVADLVAACFSVQYLFLSKAVIACIHCSGCPVPVFRNMTRLHLDGLGAEGWELFPHLLHNAPNLEFLYITKGLYEDKGCYARIEGRLLECVPDCLSLHLKKLEIWAFNGEEDEMKLVEYFLKSAKVLNKIKIWSDSSWEKILCFEKKVLMLPKLSDTCQILIMKDE